MIRKLRLKVSFLTTAVVAVIIISICVAVVLFTRYSFVQQSNLQLQNALSTDIFSRQRPDQTSSQPCFTARVTSSGEIWISGSSYFDLGDDDVISSIVTECLSLPDDTGTLSNYSLRYLRQSDLSGAIQIAFTDCSVERQILRSMTISTIAIALASVLVLFVITWFLSGPITRPVEKAWTEQRRFLSDASHELKTPLTVILSSADLLDGHVSTEDIQYVDNIRSESRRMKKLVDSMLTLSRADNGQQKLPLTLQNFSELLVDSLLLFEPVAFESGKELNYDVEEDLYIQANQDHIHQLAGILIDNAIKYAPNQSTIHISLSKVGKNARLLVANQGTPIPAEKIPHLFERFYRTDEARSGPEGFGLGLSIAQSIANEHKGSISCESDTDSTRFIVLIPLAPHKNIAALPQ